MSTVLASTAARSQRLSSSRVQSHVRYIGLQTVQFDQATSVAARLAHRAARRFWEIARTQRSMLTICSQSQGCETQNEPHDYRLTPLPKLP
eukprot:6200384-Pleurochrysis_carterae.AAC.11